MPVRRAATAALALLLAACGDAGSVTDALPDVEFRLFEPSDAGREPEPRAPVLSEAEIERRPVARVLALELGRTRRGRLLVAEGEAPLTGWFQPVLSARRDGAPGPDGFIEFDLLAAPPELNGGAAGAPGTPAQRRIRAVRLLSDAAIAAAAGVRVHAAEGPPAALRLAGPAPAG